MAPIAISPFREWYYTVRVPVENHLIGVSWYILIRLSDVSRYRVPTLIAQLLGPLELKCKATWVPYVFGTHDISEQVSSESYYDDAFGSGYPAAGNQMKLRNQGP